MTQHGLTKRQNSLSALKSAMSCPLCLQVQPGLYHRDRKRSYFRCSRCDLVFVSSDQLPAVAFEKARYLLHQNHADNKGYLDFLQTLINPLLSRVKQGAKGLDYGSGPEPVFAELLRNNGYQVEIYDPFFADDKSVLQHRYDFLTCVETVEHFHNPRKDWKLMRDLVREEGWIGVKTSFLEPAIDFSSWYYKEDPTHVCFYSKKTLRWIGTEFELTSEFEGTSNIFFQAGKKLLDPIK
jgi:hypothetical protein